MADKIPNGYRGHFMENSSGGHTLVMVSESEYDTPQKNQKKEQSNMADKKTTAKAKVPTQTNTGHQSGKDFSASQKYQYHKKEANKAFNSGDIVKSSNHLSAMRRAENTLREQAKWARENKPR